MKRFSPLLLLLLLTINVKAQYSCATAVAITNGYTSGTITTPGTSGSQDWITTADASCGTASNAAFTGSDVYVFSYTTGATAGGAFYFTINNNDAVDGQHAVGVWTGCSGSTLSTCKASTYKFHDIIGVCVQNLTASTTYYIGVGKQFGTKALKFNVVDFVVETSTSLPADECVSAPLINIATPYSGSTRCAYTASAGSPTGCGSIENDSWVRFIASATTAVVDYNVSNCTLNYGVQLTAYSGSCGSLTQIAGSCINYASNNGSGTWTFSGLTIGNSYFIRADGYAGDLCSYSYTPVSGVNLPITLTDFSGIALENKINKIKWTTASEINNNYFVLEKSYDGDNFTTVNKVKGAGNSTSINNYEVSETAEKTNTYYRLKQVDFNGSYAYSKVISVTNNSDNNLNVFPNPSTNGIFEVTFEETESSGILEVYNLQGQKVFQTEVKDTKRVEVNLANQQTGIYRLNYRGESFSFNKKIFIN